MVCPKCGKDLKDEQAVFCSQCGYKINPTKNKWEINAGTIKTAIINFFNKFRDVFKSIISDKRKIAFILIGVLVTIFIINFNTPVKAIERIFLQGKYTEAEQLYSETSNKIDFEEKTRLNSSLRSFFETEANKTIQQYAQNEIEFIEAKNLINGIKTFGFAEAMANNYSEKLNGLRESKVAFRQGEVFMKNKKPIEALTEFGKVVKEDSYYEKAREYITTVLPEVKERKLIEAENAYKNKDYKTAYEALSIILPFYKEDKELQKKVSYYKELKEKAEKEEKNQRMKQLLALTTKYVDPVTNDVTYVPKPHKDLIYIPRNGVVFYPYMRGELGNDVLKLIAGFNRNDWVFMKRIICNADGYIFNLEFDYFDRQSEVGFGSGVYEWVEFASYDSLTGDYSLIENLQKLGNAEKAQIKFEGDTQALYYTLSKREKDIIKNMVELHLLSTPVPLIDRSPF